MTTPAALQPTLWRTCRSLANRTRLQILGLLSQQPGQTVTGVASRLNLPLPVASQSLRSLESRGLLVARRVKRSVEYRLSPANAPNGNLVQALRLTFEREHDPVEMLFKLATAFTHPRRIDIYRALAIRPLALEQIKAMTGISIRALQRHLRKLENRGFVIFSAGLFTVAIRRDPCGREFVQQAVR